MSAAEVLNTDCLTALRDLPDASVDAARNIEAVAV